MKTTAVASAASLLLLMLALNPALAQNKKIYRCEDAAGRVTYSDEVCRGGTELKHADERSGELEADARWERALLVCRQVAARGQALVTTAHPGWADRLRSEAQLFQVEAGAVRAA